VAINALTSFLSLRHLSHLAVGNQEQPVTSVWIKTLFTLDHDSEELRFSVIRFRKLLAHENRAFRKGQGLFLVYGIQGYLVRVNYSQPA